MQRAGLDHSMFLMLDLYFFLTSNEVGVTHKRVFSRGIQISSFMTWDLEEPADRRYEGRGRRERASGMRPDMDSPYGSFPSVRGLDLTKNDVNVKRP